MNNSVCNQTGEKDSVDSDLLAVLKEIIALQGDEDAIHGTAVKLPFRLEAAARAAIANAESLALQARESSGNA